jgi:hypothetical protein
MFKDGRIERFQTPDDPGGMQWAGLSFRDITEAKRREDSTAVYQISELTNCREPQDLFRSIHATIGELMPAEFLHRPGRRRQRDDQLPISSTIRRGPDPCRPA